MLKVENQNLFNSIDIGKTVSFKLQTLSTNYLVLVWVYAVYDSKESFPERTRENREVETAWQLNLSITSEFCGCILSTNLKLFLKIKLKCILKKV